VTDLLVERARPAIPMTPNDVSDPVVAAPHTGRLHSLARKTGLGQPLRDHALE
jgi:hypothetical protein